MVEVAAPASGGAVEVSVGERRGERQRVADSTPARRRARAARRAAVRAGGAAWAAAGPRGRETRRCGRPGGRIPGRHMAADGGPDVSVGRNFVRRCAVLRSRVRDEGEIRIWKGGGIYRHRGS